MLLLLRFFLRFLPLVLAIIGLLAIVFVRYCFDADLNYTGLFSQP